MKMLVVMPQSHVGKNLKKVNMKQYNEWCDACQQNRDAKFMPFFVTLMPGKDGLSMGIVLLTDFGTSDSYVGVMKGVIAGICPDAQVIDLTHAVVPQNIRHGAFTLLNAYRYFPSGTIFLTVVDPGVGSVRRAMAVRAGDYLFVAPDNGLLSYVLHETDVKQMVALDNPTYRLSSVSYTFHGRDIFAPAAAHLAAGVALDQLGTPIEQPVMLDEPVLKCEIHQVTGEIVHIDHFGNLVTSVGLLEWITRDALRLSPRFGREQTLLDIKAARADIKVYDHVIKGVVESYSRTPPGSLLAMVGSSGYLEIAVNGGSTAAALDARIGDPVEMRIG
jgi:hypothetical protein